MTLDSSFSSINSLTSATIIAGATFYLRFPVKNADGTTPTLTNSDCVIYVSPWGQNYTVLTKTCSLIASGSYQAAFAPADTLSFSGKYTYQPVVTTGSTTIRPSQGILTFVKALQ